MSENLICRTTNYSFRLSYSSLYGTRRFVTVFHRAMPLTHSCSLRARHWIIRCHVHCGLPLDHSLTCSGRARHWAIHYRVCKWHATGHSFTVLTESTLLDHPLSFSQEHATGSFVTLSIKATQLDHSLPFSQRAHHCIIGPASSV
jgi:hypothetical protein